MIVFKGVTKRYGRTYALSDASFKVEKGAMAGFIGPNGSGKTTSLKLMLGLLRRDSGEIEVLGHDPWVEGEIVRSFTGFLPESPIYPRNIKVRQLLDHMARLKAASRFDVARIARLVGIQDYMEHKISALSRGYLQRLGLAIALLGDPEILLLDEPTANLDPKARMEILRLVSVLRRDLGATIVISSHILPELQQVIDSIILISRGRIVDYGSIDYLASKYGARIVYAVYTGRPRILMKRLVDVDYVRGVVDRGEYVEVHIDPLAVNDFLGFLDGMGGDLVSRIEVRSGYLGEIYERALAT